MKFLKLTVIAILSLLCSVSCQVKEEMPDANYGYVQFKVYKAASYEPASKAIKGQLDYLSDAAKIKVTLKYGENYISQTLILSATNDEAAEYGLRSEKLRLLAGEYKILLFTLYDKVDEPIYEGTAENSNLTVVAGGNTQHDILANVTGRGKIQFTFTKKFPETKASTFEFTFDEIKYVTVTLHNTDASVTNSVEKFEMLPVNFDLHFDENNEANNTPGYYTSTLVCDSLLAIPAGTYKLYACDVYNQDKKELRKNKFDASNVEYVVSDNKTTEADVPLDVYTTNDIPEYIKDYKALKEIWESLDGPNWSYFGEANTDGCNWDFNKDVDLWGDQPGVKLHSNGRVAFIDVSDFGFKGDLSPAIGQLTELVELYLGTHNDDNILIRNLNLNPELRRTNPMEYHRAYMQALNPVTQFTAPIAFGLMEKGIDSPAIALHKAGVPEKEILESQDYQVMPLDVNIGKTVNGLNSLPKEIGNLKKLETFFIANASISSLPDEMANLTSCTDLEIYNCPNMTEFPVVIAQMPSLVSLNLSNNPQWDNGESDKGISALANGPSAELIQILYFRNNALTEFSADMRNFKKLGLADFTNNKITTLVPLGKDISFTQLYLTLNQIEEVPVDADGYFCGFEDIETLSFSYNKIKNFPNMFDKNSMYALGTVDFSFNQISSLPADFKGINVNVLSLAHNKFETYPVELTTSNSKISQLNLRSNGMTTIPDKAFDYRGGEYENLLYTVTFDLSYNKLTDLGESFHAGHFPYLYSVDLSYNCFNKFPFEPLDANSLVALAVRGQRDLNGNRCLREWPTGIYAHTGLRGLYLGSNDFRKIDDTISTICYILEISDNPNIEFDASDICYAWYNGAYILMYDKTQKIINCDYMLE